MKIQEFLSNFDNEERIAFAQSLTDASFYLNQALNQICDEEECEDISKLIQAAEIIFAIAEMCE